MSERTETDLPTTHRIKIDRSGRFVLPSAIRKRLGWGPGDLLLLSTSGDQLNYRRWEGSVEDLDARDRADRVASLITECNPAQRELLIAALSERHGITIQSD